MTEESKPSNRNPLSRNRTLISWWAFCLGVFTITPQAVPAMAEWMIWLPLIG